MTFYEAALRVLATAGAPLHADEITKRSLDQGLLSHVGKNPEVTMLARLAAMAKRPRDRQLTVTAKDTFALMEWMLPEDSEALATTGVLPVNPEEGLPPYRSVERLPEARTEFLRVIGRQAEFRKRRDDDGKRKKYPPIGEVVVELLTEASGALVPSELLARMRQRELCDDDLSVHRLLEGLADDNQSRIDQSQRPQFAMLKGELGDVQVALETSGEGGPAPIEIQQTFCQLANLKFENGRVVLRSEHQRSQVPSANADDAAALQNAKTAGKEARRAAARVLRARLAALDGNTFEKVCMKLLHGLHLREVKVARRFKDGLLASVRKKDGSLEMRVAVRVFKEPVAIERRHIQDARKDAAGLGCHAAIVMSAGELRGDGRTEALANGLFTSVWCADALADRFLEAHVGVTVTRVELFDIDETFFTQAKLDADEAAKRREERHRERDAQRSARPSAPGSGETESEGAPAPVQAADGAAPEGVSADGAAGADEGDDEGDDGDGPEEGGAQAQGAPGEGGGRRKRRRRRRRGRGGQGGQGALGAPGVSAEGAPAAGGGGDGAQAAAAPASAPAPAPASPSGGDGGSSGSAES